MGLRVSGIHKLGWNLLDQRRMPEIPTLPTSGCVKLRDSELRQSGVLSLYDNVDLARL